MDEIFQRLDRTVRDASDLIPSLQRDPTAALHPNHDPTAQNRSRLDLLDELGPLDEDRTAEIISRVS